MVEGLVKGVVLCKFRGKCPTPEWNEPRSRISNCDEPRIGHGFRSLNYYFRESSRGAAIS